MTHTGDIYETRARAARHAELRRLTRAISRLLFPDRTARSSSGRQPATGILFANDSGLNACHRGKNCAA